MKINILLKIGTYGSHIELLRKSSEIITNTVVHYCKNNVEQSETVQIWELKLKDVLLYIVGYRQRFRYPTIYSRSYYI